MYFYWGGGGGRGGGEIIVSHVLFLAEYCRSIEAAGRSADSRRLY